MGLFQKVEKVRTGIKVLGYGGTGSGKSTFGLSCALGNKGICAIDSEDGLKFYSSNPNLKYILNTSSYDELEEALEEIENELIDDIETVLIDSETKFADNLNLSYLSVVEKRAKRKGQDVEDANLSLREYGKIKLIHKKLQALKIKLASQGINIISICQEKEIKEKKGDNWIVTGYSPDTNNKNLAYDYDIVLRFFTEKDIKTGEEIFKAEVQKDRTGVFKKGTIITNPTFSMWKSVYDEYSTTEKQKTLDFNKDFERDEKKLQESEDGLADIITQFKTIAKQLPKEDMIKVQKLCKDKGVDNPLKATDLGVMKEIVEFMTSLQ